MPPVTTTVIPIIEGEIKDAKCIGGGYPLNNLDALTDGTLAAGNPDHFYGVRPEQLNRQIRNELLSLAITFNPQHNNLPMLSNFFLEAKGPDGSAAEATRHACYDGTLGARGMHTLQSYVQDEPVDLRQQCLFYNINLSRRHAQDIYHPSHQADQSWRSPMTQVNSWSLVGNLETCREGITACRIAET